MTFRQHAGPIAGSKPTSLQVARVGPFLALKASMSLWLIRAVQTLRVGGTLGAIAFAASGLVTVATSSLYVVPQTAYANPVPAPQDSEAPRWASSLPARQGASESVLSGPNPFCPTCRPETIASFSDAPLPPGGGARASSLPLRLYATMEAEDPRDSQATIANLTSGQTGLFGVGDTLDDGVTIAAVATGVVHVHHNGALEFITVSELPQPPEPKVPSRADRPSEPKAPTGLEDADESIDCSDDFGRCQVDRAFVEKLFANPTILMGQAAARPGKTADGGDGFTLSRIRRGSLPDKIGLQSGDILVAVSGRPATIDNLTTLYGSMRRAEQVTFEIERNGQRQERALVLR